MSKATIIAIVFLCASFAAAARGGRYNIGKPAAPQQVRAFDISVSPSGAGLPPGEGTARSGRDLYLSQCAFCHGEKGEGKPGSPALAGGIGTLKSAEPVLTVGSFWPYSTTVWDYINRAMPPQNPGSLTPSEVYSVTAYVLHLNGLVKEEETIDAKTLPKIVMPNRNGFVPDPRPDVNKTKPGVRK
jgi:S-disulfanyl-L-cysteine oxidoreductase SoxD